MKKLVFSCLLLAIAVIADSQNTGAPLYGPAPDPKLQVSQYIRRIFEDRDGNLWFGTNGDGVCRYNGRSLTYFNPANGFAGYAVRGITEDSAGNLWFATDEGIVRYDAMLAKQSCNTGQCEHDQKKEADRTIHNRELSKSFTTYTVKDGLSDKQVWSILYDKSGIFWFGTEGGVNRFDPNTKTFSNFALPAADLSKTPNAYPAPKLVNVIYQDKSGIIWLGTNGNGTYRLDGKNLVNFSDKNGLCNNFVQTILEDHNGVIWMGTRFGGISRYDGKTFTTTTFDFEVSEGLSKNFIWLFMEDKAGNMWIATAGGGLYVYSNNSFTRFSVKDGLPNKFVQSLWEDKSGRLWVGTSGGLFRRSDKPGPVETATFVNVTVKGT